jgi:hypothetical protein
MNKTQVSTWVSLKNSTEGKIKEGAKEYINYDIIYMKLSMPNDYMVYGNTCKLKAQNYS